MKIKFLSIAIACVLALALASCGGTPKPSGDPVKDAKAFVEKELSLAEGMSSKEDIEKAQKTYEEMEKAFNEAYKDKPEELAKFKEELTKLREGEFKDKYDQAKKKAEEILNK